MQTTLGKTFPSPSIEHVPDEHSREKEIARVLQIDISDIAEGYISERTAKRIVEAHSLLILGH
jgi:hypothetical protein